jgi:hypothetical protein
MALPWVSQGGQDVTLSDIRDQYDGVDAPSDFAYMVTYARWIWIVVLGVGAAGLLIGAAVVPSSKSVRMVIGFCTAGLIGVIAHAVDERGTVAPRINGALVVLVAFVLHAGAYADWFAEDAAPDPAFGVWAGFIGLGLVMIGCLMGTRTVPVGVPAPAWAPAQTWPR